MFQLILIRHGESVWNLAQRFTGWADIDLTETGVAQMRSAGRLLREKGLDVDLAYTSALSRCIRSQSELLNAMDRADVPSIVDWRLNERHYGALTGMSKPAAVRQFGAESVHRWRRSYDAEPPRGQGETGGPAASDSSHAQPGKDNVPDGESLRQVVDRVRPLWDDSVGPAVRAGKRVIITAHGNSLRALMKLIEGISDADIVSLEIPNAVPIVYELDAALKPNGRFLIGEAQASSSQIL
jgi:2,3-bisphosphoglycerate-dependent phosphoglycerate mutase